MESSTLKIQNEIRLAVPQKGVSHDRFRYVGQKFTFQEKRLFGENLFHILFNISLFYYVRKGETVYPLEQSLH